MTLVAGRDRDLVMHILGWACETITNQSYHEASKTLFQTWNEYIDAKLSLGGDRGYGIRARTSMAGKLLAK